MGEEIINLPDEESEAIPTLEEVQAVLRELIGKEYKVVRQAENEKGLCLLEVTIPGEEEGEEIEYGYRTGLYQEGKASGIEIHVTYFKDGTPISGTSVARYVDGKWKIIR